MNFSLVSKEIKTLVLIIASDDHPVYAYLQEEWRSYMHLDPEHFECYFIRGNNNLPTRYSIEGDIIWSKTEENFIPGILNKTLISFEAMLPRLSEFDYVLRANLSSFFVFSRFLDFLKTLPKKRCYSGLHHGRGDPCIPSGWVNGSGIIMSVDLVEMLVKNSSVLFDLPYDFYNIDDAAIAKFFVSNDINIINGKVLEIHDLAKWQQIKNAIPEDVYHFRVKTTEPLRFKKDLLIHSHLKSKFY